MKRKNGKSDLGGILISIGILISSILGSISAIVVQENKHKLISFFEKSEMIIVGIVFGVACSIIFYSIYKLFKKRKWNMFPFIGVVQCAMSIFYYKLYLK